MQHVPPHSRVWFIEKIAVRMHVLLVFESTYWRVCRQECAFIFASLLL